MLFRSGSIESGKLADLIVVSQDIFRADPHSIGATEVLLTMVGGKIVYQSPAWRSASAAIRCEGCGQVARRR